MERYYACLAKSPQTFYSQPKKNSNVRVVIRPGEFLFDVVAVPDFPGWWEGKFYNGGAPPVETEMFIEERREKRGFIHVLSPTYWQHFVTQEEYEEFAARKWRTA